MKRKIFILISGILLSVLLISCTFKTTDKYEIKQINVYYVNSENNTTCDLRYYNKSEIPYISLKDYNQLLYRGRKYPEGRDAFYVTKKKNVYTVKTATGIATFDTRENTLESDDLWNFKNTNLNGMDLLASVSYDGLPFTKVVKAESDGISKKTIIDLDDYGMKMYGDDKNVYVPLGFACDLFSNENILHGAYNSKDLYITNYTENEEVSSFGKDYYDPIFENPLTEEYASYVYNELCLDYDYFLGRTGRSSLERYYDLSNGLDKALDSRELGKTIKEYMQSTDLSKFLVGSSILGYLRCDGGHSNYFPLSTSYYDKERKTNVSPKWLTTEIKQEASNLLNEKTKANYEELSNYDKSFSKHSLVYKARSEKLNKVQGTLKGTDTYTKDGDVAYIHIDGFMGEIGLQNEWKDYYAGKRDTIPFGKNLGGAVGAIYNGVIEVSKDKEIKHLVIDLAANTGGSTDEMLFMIGLLTGSKKFYSYNRMTDAYVTATYAFDFNLDKVFDEKDDEMLKLLDGVDITVLTTRNGFSCGGISPIYLHEEGLFTIGEECGGGACSIYIQYDGYGNMNVASTPSQTVTKNKVSIDVARKTVCDAQLEFKINGSYNYTSLYDTNTLRELITKHYNN